MDYLSRAYSFQNCKGRRLDPLNQWNCWRLTYSRSCWARLHFFPAHPCDRPPASSREACPGLEPGAGIHFQSSLRPIARQTSPSARHPDHCVERSDEATKQPIRLHFSLLPSTLQLCYLLIPTESGWSAGADRPRSRHCPRGVMDNALASEAGNTGSIPVGGNLIDPEEPERIKYQASPPIRGSVLIRRTRLISLPA